MGEEEADGVKKLGELELVTNREAKIQLSRLVQKKITGRPIYGGGKLEGQKLRETDFARNTIVAL